MNKYNPCIGCVLNDEEFCPYCLENPENDEYEYIPLIQQKL